MDGFVQVKPRDDGNWTIVLGWRDAEFPIEDGELNKLATILFAMGFGEHNV